MTLDQVKMELLNYDEAPVKIMEVCGTHTASIFKHGIRSLLSPKIQLISGPGCPVCVTSAKYIDKLVELSMKENHCVLTFGDMMKVKGSGMSLTDAKACGGHVQILYSPLSAIQLAMEKTDTQFIFAAVGFETTIPIYAIIIDEIIKNEIKNLKLLTSLKSIVPALEYICEKEEGIDGFLCPGHVSVITGSSIYEGLAEKYRKPFVVTGFEGEHILAAVYEIIRQISCHGYEMKNMYISAVRDGGNQKAKDLIRSYFEISDVSWRGIGVIPNSAFRLKGEYLRFDAGSHFEEAGEQTPSGCRCREVILGRINPSECPMFQKVCTPMNAVGPCMVSAEGACGIWYRHR